MIAELPPIVQTIKTNEAIDIVPRHGLTVNSLNRHGYYFPQNFLNNWDNIFISDTAYDINFKRLNSSILICPQETTFENTQPLSFSNYAIVDEFDIQKIRFSVLQNQFLNELSTYIESESAIDLKPTFELLAKELSKVDFIDSIVEITPSSSLKFTLLFEGEKMLMISKSFERFDDQPTENIVIFSLFIERKLIVSDALEIKDLVQGFKKYLSDQTV